MPSFQLAVAVRGMMTSVCGFILLTVLNLALSTMFPLIDYPQVGDLPLGYNL